MTIEYNWIPFSGMSWTNHYEKCSWHPTRSTWNPPCSQLKFPRAIPLWTSTFQRGEVKRQTSDVVELSDGVDEKKQRILGWNHWISWCFFVIWCWFNGIEWTFHTHLMGYDINQLILIGEVSVLYWDRGMPPFSLTPLFDSTENRCTENPKPQVTSPSYLQDVSHRSHTNCHVHPFPKFIIGKSMSIYFHFHPFVGKC